MKSLSFKIIAPIVVGILIVQVVKNWHSLPFNQKSRQLKTIEISADIYGKGQVNISVSNSGYVDIKDPLISCQSFGQSGTEIKETKFTIYQSITPSNKALFNKAFNTNSQVAYLKCKVIDVIVLNTINGKEPKPIMIKRVNSS